MPSVCQYSKNICLTCVDCMPRVSNEFISFSYAYSLCKNLYFVREEHICSSRTKYKFLHKLYAYEKLINSLLTRGIQSTHVRHIFFEY